MTRMLKLCLVLSLMCAAIVGSRAASDPTVFINEFHYDNTGTDAGEFVEIAGPAGTTLGGYSIVLYNGADGKVYDTDALSGIIPNHQNGFGTVSLAYPVNGIQNGAPDAIALVSGGVVVQFLSYEGAFTAVDGPAGGMTSTNIGVSEIGTEPLGRSLQLQGTGTTYQHFSWSAPIAHTSNAVNTGQTFEGAATATIAINDVSVSEGNGGTANATFTVTVTGAHDSGVTFDITTADGTATVAGGDYAFNTENGQISSAANTYSFTVAVNGDLAYESDEQFAVNLTNVVGAGISDGQGIGTITNDDEAPPVTSDVVISQVYGGGGNSGATYTHDFIELFNRSHASVSLSGWSVQYTSAAGAGPWTVTPLSGSIAAGGYYLIQQAAGNGGTTALPTPDASGSIAMGAGAGKVALRQGVTPIPAACPVSGVTADLVGYGPTATCDEGSGPTAATSNTTAALRKRGGCFDSNNNNTDFSIGSPTPRNSVAPTKSCDFTSAAIHAIQGDDAVTPFLGVDVITSGIVTGRKSNGFFMQTSDEGDFNPLTSQGLFVFTGAAPAVVVGDAVTARGTAGEFFGLTRLESSLPGDVAVDSSGHIAPAPVTITPAILNPDGAPDQLERYEGMRMHADSLTSVAPTNEFGEISTVLTGVARPMREPGIEISLPVPPDPSSGVPDCCIPRWDENPERILIDSDGLGAPVVAVTSHVTLADVTGPLDYSFGAYKVLPETPLVASANVSAVAVPVAASGEFTIAGFNIENFANNDTQRRKAALAIRQVLQYPDVMGHVEIRDLASLQALAAQVNADALAAGNANPAYEARLIEAPAGGTQNLGFLVKTSRVQIDAVTQELGDETFGPQPAPPARPIYLHDRPPLVLRATVTLPGRWPRPVIVVVNHLRSFIDVELLSSEGDRVRAKRTAQAESTARLLQSLQTDNPTTPVISIGDYNAYQFNDGYTDPIAILKGAPTPDDQIVVDESPDLVTPDFINLTDSLQPESERYSFVFEGTPQALDHALVNGVAAGLVQRYAIARNNADFPEGALYAGDVTRPERNSDHDMPVAYFAYAPVALELLEAIESDLEGLLAAGTPKDLAKRLESTLADVRKAIGEFDADHRGRVTAAVFIASAIRDLEDILKKGLLDGPTVHGFVQRLTEVSRLLHLGTAP